MKNTFLVFLSTLLLLSSCGTSTDDPMITTGDASDFQKTSIDFGLSTFQEAVTNDDENILISPLSLETALYMTMNGCNGETLEEFRTALQAEKFYPEGINTQYRALIEKLVPTNESTKLGMANSVFYDISKVSMNQSFEETISDVFNAEFISAEFQNPNTVDLINEWVKENTENRIDKILDKIDPDEVIFLINALFFTADWKNGFFESSTSAQLFTKENGEAVSVDMMYSDTYRKYYQGDEFSAVDLLFSNEEYSMTFILPKNESNTKEFINGYSQTDFYEFYIDLYANKLQENRVFIQVPKFEIKSELDMKDILKEMGIKSAFNNADFSKMATFSGRTYLSKVLHDVVLKIDEKGVEGAAVTAVGVGATSAPPSIYFTRPFIFVIRHVETNTPIFIGRLADPS
ncbi:MAG: serpin family protein [Saprospiraceae bacterium]|nr:serpin family protein [Saprospiraceae bacterium]